MTQTIQDELSKMSKNLQTLVDFCNKYEFTSIASIYGVEHQPKVNLNDAVEAGKLFGKEGWTREREQYSTDIRYNWTRMVEGVKVTIIGAEVHEDMNKTPVPPKAFPIQIEDAS